MTTLGLTLALMLAGCSVGGSTRPNGYNCVNGSGGCITQLALSHAHINGDGKPDIAGDPAFGVQSDLYIVPISCDANCRASSGNGTPGYIGNFLVLWDSHTGWYIRLGYETTMGGTQYVMQYWLADIKANPNATVYLGPTNVEPGFNQPAPRSTFAIGPADFGSPVQWGVFVADQQGNILGEHFTDKTSFHPDYALYVQIVYGTSGAWAKYTGFVNNYIFTSLNGNADDAILAEDGAVPAPVETADHPTNALWAIHPRNSITGGYFWVSCCQPS